MELQRKKLCSDMTEQEKQDLLVLIKESSTSKDWSKLQKEQILSQLKTDKEF
jgi:hypothetical protein